jgi:uncharacterized protein (TIGR00369 family)
MPSSRITADEFKQILRDGMPSGARMAFDVVTLEHGLAVLRQTAGADELRPGGTVSGPALFAFADLAMYAAILSIVGNVPLAVTTDATVHFLRRPRPGALVARAKVLKEGKRLVVGTIQIAPEGDESAPVAHFVMTYSVPPGAAPNETARDG